MKKLCRRRGAVHPSPPILSDHLAFLPVYLHVLAASLSPADLEVLAYLITANNSDGGTPNATVSKKGTRKNPSSGVKARAAGSCSVSGGGGSKGAGGGDDGDHDPNFCCDCFRCYMSYWVRWDKSPNRQLIDEIIDAYEAGLVTERRGRGGRGRKDRRKTRGSEAAAAGAAEPSSGEIEGGEKGTMDTEIDESETDEVKGPGGGEEETEKGSVRRLVSFIGERIWGVWRF